MFSDNKNLKNAISKDSDFIPEIPMDMPKGILSYMDFLNSSSDTSDFVFNKHIHRQTTTKPNYLTLNNYLNGTGDEY